MLFRLHFALGYGLIDWAGMGCVQRDKFCTNGVEVEGTYIHTDSQTAFSFYFNWISNHIHLPYSYDYSLESN